MAAAEECWPIRDNCTTIKNRTKIAIKSFSNFPHLEEVSQNFEFLLNYSIIEGEENFPSVLSASSTNLIEEEEEQLF